MLELAQWDAVRIAPGTMRGFEGGPDGAELLAFGAPNTENKDAEMVQGWWRGGPAGVTEAQASVARRTRAVAAPTAATAPAQRTAAS